MRELGALISTLLPLPELQRQAFESIREWVTDPGRVATSASLSTSSRPSRDPEQLAVSGESRAGSPLAGARGYAQKDFATALERAKADLRGIVPLFVDSLREILTLRQALLVVAKPPPWLQPELERLVPPDFLRRTPYLRLAHLPRYLKALQVRVDRWRQDPARDARRASQVAPYETAIERLKARAGRETFRWLVEEFKVSVFAQELGTAEPVSAVKLDRTLATLGGEAPKETVAAKPIVAAAVTEKKGKPIKNLGALDRLFRP
jgi:ATP-dependent helicase HrpA